MKIKPTLSLPCHKYKLLLKIVFKFVRNYHRISVRKWHIDLEMRERKCPLRLLYGQTEESFLKCVLCVHSGMGNAKAVQCAYNN